MHNKWGEETHHGSDTDFQQVPLVKESLASRSMADNPLDPQFRLRARTLKVESAVWQDRSSVFDRCSCNQTQNEAHVLFNCTDEQVCSLRREYHVPLKPYFQNFSEARPFLLHQVSS
eukprot:312781-Pelagomonas_calceolata.AAC.1